MSGRGTPRPPELSDALETAEGRIDALETALRDGEDVEGVRFVSVVFDQALPFRITLRGCAFERCVFPAGAGDRAPFDFIDCAFRGCDLSGLNLERAALHRVSLTECRATGASFVEASLRDAAFSGCQMDYSLFALARLERVQMARCSLAQAVFTDAKFQSVHWESCRLTGADLCGVRLKGMDLRTNDLTAMVLRDLREVSGAVLSAEQACLLAALLGAQVKI